jgi:Protein of unknown function (DUF3485)
MLSSARRYLLIVLLLSVVAGFTWAQRWSLAARLRTEAVIAADEGSKPAAQVQESIYFLDIEGWYRITPYETVVRSPYDLTADTTEAMAATLPTTLGTWQQLGVDEYIGDDPAVVFYLKQPTVALQRTYQDPSGRQITLAIIGNKGEDSYLLFSHTPETCYPGRLWQVIENRRESALLDDQPMYAQYLLTQHAETGEQLLVLFWYLWDNPQRDAQDGVLSMRLNLFLGPGESKEIVLARAWDFIRQIFPSTVRWERF